MAFKDRLSQYTAMIDLTIMMITGDIRTQRVAAQVRAREFCRSDILFSQNKFGFKNSVNPLNNRKHKKKISIKIKINLCKHCSVADTENRHKAANRWQLVGNHMTSRPARKRATVNPLDVWLIFGQPFGSLFLSPSFTTVSGPDDDDDQSVTNNSGTRRAHVLRSK